MSRMPPSFNGGLVCAKADVADSASTDAASNEKTRFMGASLGLTALAAALFPLGAIMPEGIGSGKARGRLAHFSAKRNGTPPRRFIVIARSGATKQCSLLRRKVDCFAALAMTCL